MPKKQWPVINKTTYKNGKETYLVDARIRGKGKRFHCATKAEAATLADQLRVKRTNAGTSAFSMPDHERVDAQAALDLLRPHGRTLMEATRYFLRDLPMIKANVSVVDLMAELELTRKQDGYAKVTLVGMKRFHKRFAADHPEAKVQDFTTENIDRWLRRRTVAPQTRNIERGQLSALFNFAVKRKYAPTNPVKDVEKANVIEREPGILTVDQCTRLMTAVHEEFLPAMALGLFAGLRPISEVLRLNWEHIDFESGLIDIAADRTKTAKKRYVTIQPNLAEWLLPFRKAEGAVFVSATRSATTYCCHLIRARLLAGLKDWPHDVLRHTFCSMHFAHFKNPGLTAQEMGHMDMTMIHKHYRERVRPADAASFWNIRPGRESNVVPMLATA